MSFQGVITKAVKKAFERGLGLVKLTSLKRKQLEQTQQELAQTKQRLNQKRQQLNKAREQNETVMRRLRAANQQLKQRFRDATRDYLLCKMPKQSICAEIGVHEGEFSRQILTTVEPRRLHLIDPWKQGEGLFGNQAAREQTSMDERYLKVKDQFAEEIAANRVLMHRALSDEIVDDFEDSYFDWIYIDGNHLYEFVKQDLEFYYPKVKNGGYITGDDYGNKGWWDNGIKKAVDEFVLLRSEVTFEVKGTQFIIRKLME